MFGDTMYIGAYKIEGNFDFANIIDQIINELGMSKSYSPTMYSYPTENDKGGHGVTYIQPITESYIAVDTYPNLTYIFIKSCVNFDMENICNLLKRNDLKIIDHRGICL